MNWKRSNESPINIDLYYFAFSLDFFLYQYPVRDQKWRCNTNKRVFLFDIKKYQVKFREIVQFWSCNNDDSLDD